MTFSDNDRGGNLRLLIVTIVMVLCVGIRAQEVWQYVDPRIGSEGVGRTFPGPSMPFGMCKPGPDCTVKPNAGWAPMPEVVTGFSQTHVSGTGGGQKYGNVLIQPLLGEDATDYSQHREREEVALGYYATTFENGIRTEITTSERCAFYRIHYPNWSACGANGLLLIDATHFLGKNPIPDQREQQQFVGAEVEVTGSHELSGYTRVRGGWNNGDAYTVYFCLQSDKAFKQKSCADGRAELWMSDSLHQLKIGISYVSIQQARRNIPACDFDTQLNRLRNSWQELLGRIQVKGSERDKRMFYTALYHTMLMPVDKSGENPKWTDTPYYDDFYAIWDTYRTSTPLITLIDEQREVDIVNSLLNIYKREGYLPDARSGDCNGRTQGGSNAEVVIADAFVKGLGRGVLEGRGKRGEVREFSAASSREDTAYRSNHNFSFLISHSSLNYELALEAMLKDADVDPGADHEKHGRGGLREYNRLGYIPYGIDRAGNRTVEYAYDDFCIAEVAKGLGREDLYERFIRQSRNWRNLWRSDYEWDGVRGYIMPRDAEGRWLDSVPWGRSKVFHPTIPYTPVTKVAPWYLPWWSTFFYEALSAEYSLSIPHDVPGLIEACGGAEAFRKRLDLFFERKRYNVGNEPSFLTPCLYHWIGRPDLTSDRVRQIIDECYNDQPDGLPGNDDSGAMSSWLAFHQMGLYPNAGQDYYLLHAPLLPEWSMRLCNGRTLHGVVKGTVSCQSADSLRDGRFERVTLNGVELPDARITHQQLMEGGELVFYLSILEERGVLEGRGVSEGRGKRGEVREYSATSSSPVTSADRSAVSAYRSNHNYSLLITHYSLNLDLNRQHRTWPLTYGWQGDTLVVTCKEAVYLIPRSVTERATGFCWDIPADGVVYQPQGTFAFVSKQAIDHLHDKGWFSYDGITWRRSNPAHLLPKEHNNVGGSLGSTDYVRADIDQTEMTIVYDKSLGLYLVTEMRRNPLGINWNITTK